MGSIPRSAAGRGGGKRRVSGTCSLRVRAAKNCATAHTGRRLHRRPVRDSVCERMPTSRSTSLKLSPDEWMDAFREHRRAAGGAGNHALGCLGGGSGLGCDVDGQHRSRGYRSRGKPVWSTRLPFVCAVANRVHLSCRERTLEAALRAGVSYRPERGGRAGHAHPGARKRDQLDRSEHSGAATGSRHLWAISLVVLFRSWRCRCLSSPSWLQMRVWPLRDPDRLLRP